MKGGDATRTASCQNLNVCSSGGEFGRPSASVHHAVTFVRSTRGVQSLRAARVLIDGAERTGWWVTIDDGIIKQVGPKPPPTSERIDLGPCDLLPGLVDVHSDCLEERARPRPTTELPLAGALLQLDTEVVSWGITTHLVCVSLDDSPSGVRTPERAAETVAVLNDLVDATRAHHMAHLRVELTSGCLDRVASLAADERVRLVSYMDHTPGQGQYLDESRWRAYYSRNKAITDEQLDAVLTRRYAASATLVTARQRVATAALDAGVALASHDDDGPDAVASAVQLGARICEFPVSADAAAAATRAGLGVVMGAPNALRGRSHLQNLSARDALTDGTLHVLASDYHPPSLLLAVYALADDGVCSLPDAVALATSAPARLLGLTDRGVIAPGLRADLVAVERRAGRPSVTQTWVAGVPAFGTAPLATVSV